MPFSRPTLTDLRNQVQEDIGFNTLLQFSNLMFVGTAQAGLAYLHYGYLDWISLQAVPFTATGEFLEGWAALKGVMREPATAASGTVTFTGEPGTNIPAGSPVTRSDNTAYATTADAAVGGGGSAVVIVVASVPAAAGTLTAGQAMTLSSGVAGINSTGSVTTATTPGADLETDDALRMRMLGVYQSPPQGGAQTDYEEWARKVPGVTRAWAVGNGFGPGTVVVYIMLDESESAFNGFPQGTNGTAAAETRGTVATGDQLAVANAIWSPLQPVTALVWVVAPGNMPVAFSISGVASADQVDVSDAIADVFLREGSPGGMIYLDDIEAEINSVPGVSDFLILSPTTDIVCSAGALPTVGTIAWS